VYYDVDSVFTGSVKEVFEHTHPFVVTYDDWTSIFRPNDEPDGKLSQPGSATYQGGFMSLGPAIGNPSVNMKWHFLRLISQHQKWHMADQGFMNYLFAIGECLLPYPVLQSYSRAAMQPCSVCSVCSVCSDALVQ
jgi:hypothetical protein